MDESIILLLEDIGTRANNSIYPARALIEPMGIRINMWKRTDDHIYADHNHMFGWTELKYVDAKTVGMVFEILSRNITDKISRKRRQHEDYQRALRNHEEYERKTRGN